MLRTSIRKVVIYFLFVPFKLILLTCQVSPNVVLCGDFNAHVGELSKVSDAHAGLFWIVLRFLRLGEMCATV